jgi:hypothetical protein
MPNSFSPADLQEKYDENWSLSSSEINSLIRHAKRLDVSNNPYSMQYSDVVLRNEDVQNPPLWFPVKSKTLDYIEPYSVFVVAKTPANYYFPFMVEVEAVDENESFSGLLTNGGSLINPVGLGRFIDYQEPIIVRYDIDDIPEINRECGPVGGAFVASKGGSGLLCLAIDEDEESEFIKAVPVPFDSHRLVKTTVAHPHASSHPVDMWVVPSGGSPGGEILSSPKLTFNAYNRTSVDIPINKFCIAIRLQKKHWYIVPWEC